jgi:hypothetical protein
MRGLRGSPFGVVQILDKLYGAKPQPVGSKGSLARRVADARGAGDPRSDADPASGLPRSGAEKDGTKRRQVRALRDIIRRSWGKADDARPEYRTLLKEAAEGRLSTSAAHGADQVGHMANHRRRTTDVMPPNALFPAVYGCSKNAKILPLCATFLRPPGEFRAMRFAPQVVVASEDLTRVMGGRAIPIPSGIGASRSATAGAGRCSVRGLGGRCWRRPEVARSSGVGRGMPGGDVPEARRCPPMVLAEPCPPFGQEAEGRVRRRGLRRLREDEWCRRHHSDVPVRIWRCRDGPLGDLGFSPRGSP